MSVGEAVRGRGPLGELRTLKRAGLSDAGDRVRSLLDELAAAGDPLDLEAAGGLLLRPEQRRQLAEQGRFAERRIALLGSSTLDALPSLLTAELVRDGVLPEIGSAGFNQWRMEILAGAPELAPLRPQLVALLLDDTAVFEGIANPLDLDEVERRCADFPAELAQWAESCDRVLGGLLVLATVPLGTLRADRLIDYRSKARLAAAWHRMNAEILALAGSRPRTVVLSDSALAARAGALHAPDRMRHAAGHAFAPEFLAAYAAELARVVRADRSRARKGLVLDLDHTLWGGVVGDDGVAALRIGGSYPGSAHLELQALAADLKAQGVLLTVCSKNDEAVAREAMATHPEMLLRPDSFVGIAANWDPKPGNVRALAEQLNIGVDSLVFVDDNPVERGLMRQLLPEVATVELPSDPAGYASALAARGDFNLLALTGEDLVRTELYRAQTRRAELERDSGSLEDYLLGLGSELELAPMDPLSSARIVQLFGKTNQFNLTGRRYTESEVAERVRLGTGAFLGGRLTDRFGDNGLIAAVALARDADGAWVVENLVLSCRVFSRQVEHTVVGLVLRAARAAGAPAVRAAFVPSAKNGAFAEFYPAVDFTETLPAAEDGVRRFEHDLGHLAELPRWVGTTPDKEPFHAF